MLMGIRVCLKEMIIPEITVTEDDFYAAAIQIFMMPISN